MNPKPAGIEKANRGGLKESSQKEESQSMISKAPKYTVELSIFCFFFFVLFLFFKQQQALFNNMTAEINPNPQVAKARNYRRYKRSVID